MKNKIIIQAWIIGVICFLILTIGSYLFGLVNGDAQYTKRDFYLVFGVQCSDRVPAQWAVNHQLSWLADIACETAKDYKTFPTDNHPLEVMTNAALKRLQEHIKLAEHFRFEIPDHAKNFHLDWPPGTNISLKELSCW